MPDAETPMALFIKIGKAMKAWEDDGFDLDSPHSAAMDKLIEQAGDVILVQLKQGFPELYSLDSSILRSAHNSELVAGFLQIPAKLYAGNQHSTQSVARMEKAWTDLKNRLVEELSPAQPGLNEQELSQLSDSEQSRHDPKQLG